jgi:hypothetical protein
LYRAKHSLKKGLKKQPTNLCPEMELNSELFVLVRAFLASNDDKTNKFDGAGRGGAFGGNSKGSYS